MNHIFSRRLTAWVAAALLLPAAALLSANDWPEWRGPARTGVSAETGLPDSWSPEGDNLAWKAPYGGRSAPVVFGDRLYLQNASGSGADLQERLMAFNADTGEVLWEHKYNLFTSDVPTHRIAWASPAVDPATGNVFAFSGNGLLMALSPAGKVLWERSLAEQFGMWTTHGGRVSSPVVDGDRLIVSGLMFLWGQHSNGAHRYVAFDKNNGHAVWMSAPEGRPTDTIYANKFIATVNGVRTIFSGGSDGAMHAVTAATGEPIWNWRVSQRGLNTAALVVGDDVIVTHSEENVGSNTMGMVAAVPASSKGTLTDKDARWAVRGVQVGYSSPVSDGQRLYALDNGGVLFAFDLKTGEQLWTLPLGTIAKASPVYADGKLYIGTENTGNAGGKFFIVRPHADRGEILDEDWLGTPEQSELIIASPIVARGRVYVTSMDAIYAIGPKGAPATNAAPPAAGGSAAQGSGPAGPVAAVLVSPTEHLVKPGEALQLELRAFDAQGRAVANPGPAKWELDGLKGTLENGRFTPAAGGGQAGLVQATIGSVTGAARIRVVPDLPWTYDFENMGETPPNYWINATGKYAIREVEGDKVLVKLADNAFAFAKRTRPFFGSVDLSDYTIQADVRSMELRRQMSDVGIVAQRYELVLFGNHQRLELQPWQPETERTVRVKFFFDKDTWYTMKLEVQTLDEGRVRARGKVWPRGEAEPEAWTIERIDPIGSLKGSPGIYADVMNAGKQGGSEIYYDNIKVYRNLASGSSNVIEPAHTEWPMWGGTPDRNMVSTMKGLPIEFDMKTGKNVQWVANVGSQTYGNPVVSDGVVLVGTNNEAVWDKAITGDKGILIAFRESDGEFLWQAVHDKLPAGRAVDWPFQGICSSPLVEDGVVYYVSNRGEVMAVDLHGFRDGKNNGPYTDEKLTRETDVDIIWRYDMMEELGVMQHNMANASPVIHGDLVFVSTSNGQDESHVNVPSPKAPAIIALNKRTGELVWEDNPVGENILHGQWSSPSVGRIGDVVQVVIGQGDGYVRGYEATKGERLWEFDTNPKDSVWPRTRNEVISTPIIVDGVVYMANGQDPEHGEGTGHLYAIDGTKRGDISPTIVKDGKEEKNPNSGQIWHYDDIRRSISTGALHDGILYYPDFSGFLHAIEAKTGKQIWKHDMFAAIWGSPMVIDNKVYLGDEDGDVTVLQAGREMKVLAESNMLSSVYATAVPANGALILVNRNQIVSLKQGAKLDTNGGAK